VPGEEKKGKKKREKLPHDKENSGQRGNNWRVCRSIGGKGKKKRLAKASEIWWAPSVFACGQWGGKKERGEGRDLAKLDALTFGGLHRVQLTPKRGGRRKKKEPS